MRFPHRLFVVLLGAFALAACEEPKKSIEEQAKALEGGDPIPTEAAGTITFPWMGKQSVMAVGDAVERMVAVADTSDPDHPDFGWAKLDGKGGGSAEITVKATDLRTGNNGRDEHLRSANWLEADKNPDVTLKVATLTRVKPTVWKATGTVAARGVVKTVEFLVNARWIGKMDHVADDGVVRVSGSFPINLKDHKIGGEWAGTPAVSAEWRVDVVLLGVLKKS